MEGSQADAAVLQSGGANSGLERTIRNCPQVVVDSDSHILHRAGDQRRLHLGSDVVLVDIGADSWQVAFLGSQQNTVNRIPANREENIAALTNQLQSGFLSLGGVSVGRNVTIRGGFWPMIKSIY
jgi:hypothetical protein